MWWWVWVLLVLAALAGAALLARSLWRRGAGVLRAVGDVGQAWGSVADRAAAAAAERTPVDTSPTIFDDPVVLRDRVAQVRRRGARLADRRRARREGTWRGWAQGPSAAQQWLDRRRAQRSAGGGHGGRDGIGAGTGGS